MRPTRGGTVLVTSFVFVAALAFSQMQSLDAKETFAAARLSSQEAAEVIRAVSNSAFDIPDSWETELRARRVDLGTEPGLVLQGTILLCGGTGNCQIFVLRKVNHRWTSLFGNEQAPIGEGYLFGPKATNGIKDLTVVANDSFDHSSRVKYRFDGVAYTAVKP
jgi:hypothetical protein